MCRAHPVIVRWLVFSPFLSLCLPSGEGKEKRRRAMWPMVLRGRAHSLYGRMRRRGTVFVARERGRTEAQEHGDWG